MKALVLVGLLVTAANAAAQPVVFALPRPAANAAGWFNSPVRVEYACARATSCPETQVIATEGAEQAITAVARDADGAEATVSGLLNIDYTVPVVTIESPAQGHITANSLLTVIAQASDALSGTASATCNGMPAGLSAAGRITCIVVLVDGLNDIAVEVSDRANNSGSAGLRVLMRGTPTKLRVVPDAAGVLAGSTRSFQVLDEFGVDVPDVIWRVSAPDRAEMSEDGRHGLTARAPGAVTVTASYRGLTATSAVTIYPGDRLPANSVQWNVESLRFIQTTLGEKPLQLSADNWITTLQPPAGIAIVQSINWGSGRLNWRMRPAVRAVEKAASVTEQATIGGAVMVMDPVAGSGSSVVRGGGFTKGAPWRYRSAGTIAKEVVRHTDGGISFMETLPDGFSRIVSLTGDTGVARGRLPLPSGVRLRLNAGCNPGQNDVREMPAQVGPVTGTKTAIVFPIVVADDREDFERCGNVTGQLLRTLYLATVGGGAPRVDHLRVYNAPAGSVPAQLMLYPIALDGHDGLLVPWTAILSPENRESRVIRISESGQQEFTLPTAGKIWLAGKEDLGVLTDGTRLVVFNVLTGEVRWNHFYPTGVRIIDVKEGRLYLESNDTQGAYDTDGRPIPKPPGGR